MSEIQPMNLQGVSHNPLNTLPKQSSLAENVRRSSQASMQKAMYKFQQKKMLREENEYHIGKRAENFMFSNYPSSKVSGDFNTSFNNIKFGPGSRERELKRWKAQVGGSLANFEKWYQGSVDAEQAGLAKSLTRDKAKYLTQGSYENAVSDLMNNMDPVKRQQLLNNSSPEVINIINSVWNPNKGRKIETLKEMLANNPIKGITAAGATAFGAFMLLKRGKFPKWLSKAGVIDKDALVPDNLLKSSMLDGKNLKPESIEEFLRRGMINKTQAVALRNGERVVPNVYIKGAMPKSGLGKGQQGPFQQGPAMDVLQPTSKNIRLVHTDINKYVKDRLMTQSQGDQLKGVLDTMVKKGENISPKSIMDKITEGGKKFEGLGKVLEESSQHIKGFGPLRNPGLIKSAGLYMGISMGVSKGAQALGMDEDKAEALGIGASIPTPAIPMMYNKIKSVVEKKGASYVMKKLATAGAWKLAARVTAAGLLGSTGLGAAASVAMLGWEMKMIYDLFIGRRLIG